MREYRRYDEVGIPPCHAADYDGDDHDAVVAVSSAVEPSPVPFDSERGEKDRYRTVRLDVRRVVRLDRQHRNEHKGTKRCALAIRRPRELEYKRHGEERENQRHQPRAPLVHAEGEKAHRREPHCHRWMVVVDVELAGIDDSTVDDGRERRGPVAIAKEVSRDVAVESPTPGVVNAGPKLSECLHAQHDAEDKNECGCEPE